MVRAQDLKEIILENSEYISKIEEIQPRVNITLPSDQTKKVVVLYGIRRSGKTYLLYEVFRKHPRNSLYLDFKDERLRNFKVDDFEKLREVYFDLYPHLAKHEVYFLLDEVQNIPSWERFARRVTERGQIRVYVSGSSSKMMPQELNTLLRGRSWGVEVSPFSIAEYLSSRGLKISRYTPHTSERHALKMHLEEYLKWGGFPEVVHSPSDLQKQKVLKEYLDALFFKDLVERYQISNIHLIDALKNKLFESAALKLSLTAFNKQLKNSFPFSKDSLYTYYKHFIESLMIFEVKKFSASSYQRTRNPAKIYLNDPGLARKVASQDQGRQLENVIFLELKRRGYEIFYFENQGECDFIAKDERGTLLPIQVTFELNQSNNDREWGGVVEACNTLKLKKGLIITFNEEYEETQAGIKIQVIPAWKWLLNQ